jgi:hypothetical protein
MKNKSEFYCESVDFDFRKKIAKLYQLGKRKSVNTFELEFMTAVTMDKIRTIY